MQDSFGKTSLRPYFADIGRVGFVAVGTIVLATSVLEYFAPGIVGNYVTPQHLAAFAALTAALALLEPAPAVVARERAAYGLAVLLLTAFVASAVWRALADAPDAQLPVSVVATFGLLLSFIAYARPRDAR